MSDQATLRTIEKLGHGLAEVRHRALSQIRTKLEHQLTTIKDLNETPDFARRLMEWFNYPTPSETEYVLELINQSIDICGETFVQLGALQFFPALRADLDPMGAEKCDQILAGLDKYRHADFEMSSISTNQSSVTALSNTQSEFEFGDLAAKVTKPSVETAPRSAYFLGLDRPTKMNQYPAWFKFSNFPWQTLTLNDRQVLQQTNSSLCSRNIQTVADYCLFLRVVLLLE